MKLIVGLGNPGKEYEKTRHNMGFIFIDEFAKKHDCNFDKTKFNGQYAELSIKSEKILLLKPQTYMNLSGESIRKFVEYFKITTEDILIINDDLDLEVGTFRLRRKGSSAGHNGLKSIEENLHTDEYKRLKIGVSKNRQIETRDYVLGKFNDEELKIIDSMEETITKLLEDFVYISFEELMSKYNRK